MSAPKLVIAGGNGFLGRHLEAHFSRLGYNVTIICRHPSQPNHLAWDARRPGPWAAALEGATALVNMAGRTVDCRYTEANKREILASRLDSTRVLGEAVAACRQPPALWLNSSTATIYAHTEGEAPANTEAAGVIGSGFSVGIAAAWEQEFNAAATPRTRKVALRTAIVFGTDGGAFPVMARLAKLGLCSPQGDGRQWISWIHVADFCRAVEFLLAHPELSGAVNVCAPAPLPNQEFNALLARRLRPVLRLPQPKWLLELGAFFIRTETELILKSRKVYPQRLLDAGFRFDYPSCEPALDELLKTKKVATEL